MLGVGTAILFLVLSCSEVNSSPQYSCLHNITLSCDPNDTCSTLSQALGQVEALGVGVSVCIKLSNGHFMLDSAQNTTLTRVNNLAIVGGGLTVIECGNNVGMTFLNSSGIHLAYLTFKNCGALQNSTSRNFSSPEMSYVEIYAGLYFLFCSDITMVNVTVRSSLSAGLVLYNNGGINSFNNCTFHSSRHKTPGGSGVILDFSYCSPGDLHCTNRVTNKGSRYSFMDCQFMYNNASWLLREEVVYPHGDKHMVLGKGGGASVSFGGNSTGNMVEFEGCKFELNLANVGGGLYAQFADVSTNNALTITDTVFYSQALDCSDKKSKWTASGGGVKIEFIYYPPDPELWPNYVAEVEGNLISFTRSKFISNMACYGGAVSLVTSRSNSSLNSNSINFDTCQFKDNQAQLSSAVDISLYYPDHMEGNGSPIQPMFKDCTFEHNHITFGNINHYPLGMGALYSARVPIAFAGHNKFTHNDGTPLVILSTRLNALTSSVTDFVNNTGRLGGAAAFFGNSWLVSYENSSFNFNNNLVKAGGKGGAIYSAHFGEHDIEQNCLFQYHKPTIHPSRWNTSFSFYNNMANGDVSSIYMTSVQPCKWPSKNTTSAGETDNVFCSSHPWHFVNSSCNREISTASSTFSVPPLHGFPAVPGWPVQVNVSAVDDYNNTMETVLVAFPYDSDIHNLGVNKSTEYLSNDPIRLYGKQNVTSLLILRTLDPRVIMGQLRVDLLLCPPGFISVPCENQSEMVCDCVCPSYNDALGCDPDDRNITLYSHHCMTYQYNKDGSPNKSLPIVVGKCPFVHTYNKLPLTADELDSVVCAPLNRTGLLCSQCLANHSMAINDQFQCVPCDPAVGWLYFLLSKILPVTILFLLVVIFNFKATSPSMNAFIFYAQIVSVSHYHNPFPFYFGVLTFDGVYGVNMHKVLAALVQALYSIFNLEFFQGIVPPFCIGYVSGLDVLAIQYVVAFYPPLLILICWGCVTLHDRSSRVAQIWRPFKVCIDKLREKTKTTTSIIDAFATFLLLTYTTFVYASFPIANQITVKNAQTRNHTPIDHPYRFYYDASVDVYDGGTVVYFVVALVIIIIVVFGPPLILLLYPLKCTQAVISKVPKNIAIKTFVESFTECYRNGTEHKGAWDYRYFAGIYFLLRISILLVMVFDCDWLTQYFIQGVILAVAALLFGVARPYKKNYYNNLDTATFTLLSLLNLFSMYNSQLWNTNKPISLPVFIINYALLFAPLLHIVLYCVCQCVRSLKCVQRFKAADPRSISDSVVVINEPSVTGESTDDPFSYVYSNRGPDDMPDRLINPHNYPHNAHKQKPKAPEIVVTKATGDRNSEDAAYQVSTENSYFLARQNREEVRSYGSVQRSQTEPQEIKKLV